MPTHEALIRHDAIDEVGETPIAANRLQQPAFPQGLRDGAVIEGLSILIRFQHQSKQLAVRCQEEIVYRKLRQRPVQQAVFQ
jgi:hypothetical protein